MVAPKFLSFFLSFFIEMRISDSLDEPLLEDPSKPITRPLSSSQYKFDRLFLKRFHRLLRILFNTNRLRAWSTTKEARKHSVFWLYITFVFIGIGYEIIVYFVGLIPSNFYTILTSRDLAGFIRYIPTCLLLVFAVATVSFVFYQRAQGSHDPLLSV